MKLATGDVPRGWRHLNVAKLRQNLLAHAAQTERLAGEVIANGIELRSRAREYDRRDTFRRRDDAARGGAFGALGESFLLEDVGGAHVKIGDAEGVEDLLGRHDLDAVVLDLQLDEKPGGI
jgi:hypothetical protein